MPFWRNARHSSEASERRHPSGSVPIASSAPPAAILTETPPHWLRALEARDFRNLTHVALTLPPDGIVIIGDNGQGKTNLLEAIAYLHLLRSVRAARDVDVVRFGAAGFTVRGIAARSAPGPADVAMDISLDPSGLRPSSGEQHTVAVGFERASRRKRVVIDGVVPERLSDALGSMPSVTFSPVDVDLVRGAPIGRRRYLDVVLATTSKRYLAALQSYRGALIRRNAAIRALARRHGVNRAAADAALVAWEPLLADAGAVLWAERAGWAREWARELAEVCAAIGEREVVRMRYARASAREKGMGRRERDDTEARDEAELRDSLTASLEEGREADLRHGATRVGPHRDDLTLSLGDRELRVYGSAGQQRTAAIGLRILEAATIRSRRGSTPVLLFDDPFAELDERRSRAILGRTRGQPRGRRRTCRPDRRSGHPRGA